MDKPMDQDLIIPTNKLEKAIKNYFYGIKHTIISKIYFIIFFFNNSYFYRKIKELKLLFFKNKINIFKAKFQLLKKYNLTQYR